MSKFNQSLDIGLSIIGALALIVMMLHVVLHAVMRAFFRAPIDGTNEIVAYWYLPVIVLLGIPAAQLQQQHITVTLATDRMVTKTASVYKSFAAALGGVVSLGFAWYGFGEAMKKMSVGSTAGVSGIVVWPVYFVVPVAFLLLFVLYARDTVLRLKRERISDASTQALLTDRSEESR